MKRKIIAWCTAFALVSGFVGLTFLLSKKNSVNYGITSGNIGFTESDKDITELVIGKSGYTVARNEKFILELDECANPVIHDKQTGKIWKSVPEDNGGNSKYSSALTLNYFSDNSTKITLYSSEGSVDKNQVRVFTLEDGVKVEYCFGEMSEDYIYPETISEERMNEFVSKMSESDAEYILRRYTLYELSKLEGQDKEYLLDKYPKLEDENLYVATDMTTKLMMRKSDEIMRKAGYTAEDKAKDNGEMSLERINPQTFKVGVIYTLTEEGFKVTVNKEDCQFYSDYPLTDINVLPYFDSFKSGEEGYFVLPSGSGALMKADNNEKEALLSLPVYGNNIALTKELEDNAQKCIFPIFGQYKNSKGYLCIVNEGSQQAEIIADRNSISSAASVNFVLIDSYRYTMSSSNPVELFATDESDDVFSAEYVLFSDMKEETAYSDMAVYYRNRLLNEGVLTEKTHGSKPLFLTEFINVINYDTLALGFLPINREFASATFNNSLQIAEEIKSYTGGENLKLLFTGWNKNGLNRQKLGSIEFSDKAGGENGYKATVTALKKYGIESYLDTNFALTESFVSDGFSKTSDAARGVNNSIVELSIKDALSNKYLESDFSLISPKQFGKFGKEYLNNEVFTQSGIGVSELTSVLYGDYSQNKLFSRDKAINEVVNVLKTAQKNDVSILGDVGNLYSLPYINLINNLSPVSLNNNEFYKDIPFVQMILHGYVDYVTESLNGSENIQKNILKLIETGSGLHYKLTVNEYEKLFETEYSHIYNTNYNHLKDEIKDSYSILNEALSGLCDKSIISHRYIADDVVCVVYENGTAIYVNYSNADYMVGNIEVPAMGYCRVEK